MLKIMVLRKRHKQMLEEAAALRAKQSGFKTRETELAAQVENASTDEEIAAVTAAVEELEAAQKSTKERLATIIEEAEAIQQEIEEAEAAAEAAAGGEDGEGGDPAESRSRRSAGAFLKRCQQFQRSGRMMYENAKEMVKRAAIAAGTNGIVGPGSTSDIHDAVGNNVSEFIDLMTVTDCTGMETYTVPYLVSDPAAADGKEGTAAAESAPVFNSIEMTPKLVNLLTYVARGIRKWSPLRYEAKINETVRRALRRKLSSKAVAAVLASPLNTTMEVTGASGAALFTPHLLSDIILTYGGDEGVEGAATLVLNKADLKAFAAVRGTNEYLPVYSITPDTANPSSGVIKDNNGLSCRYCLNKNVAALSAATLSSAPVKGPFYGNPKCAELALWGGVDVTVNEGYKFGEGLLSVLGEVYADAAVTMQNGFVVVTGKKSA